MELKHEVRELEYNKQQRLKLHQMELKLNPATVSGFYGDELKLHQMELKLNRN